MNSECFELRFPSHYHEIRLGIVRSPAIRRFGSFPKLVRVLDASDFVRILMGVPLTLSAQSKQAPITHGLRLWQSLHL